MLTIQQTAAMGAETLKQMQSRHLREAVLLATEW
jgi:hypothetical protein